MCNKIPPVLPPYGVAPVSAGHSVGRPISQEPAINYPSNALTLVSFDVRYRRLAAKGERMHRSADFHGEPAAFVDRLVAPVETPDFGTILTTPDGTVHSHERDELMRRRVVREFPVWKNYVTDLIIAQAAQLAGRLGELERNRAALCDAWEQGALLPVVSRQDVIPREIMLSLSAACRYPERAIRRDTLVCAANLLETFNTAPPPPEAHLLARRVHSASPEFLSGDNSPYDQSVIAMALHRSLPAMSPHTRDEASMDIVRRYVKLIGGQETAINLRLMEAFAILVMSLPRHTVHRNRHSIEEGTSAVGFVSHHGETNAVKAFAARVHEELSAHLNTMCPPLPQLHLPPMGPGGTHFNGSR